MLKLYLIHTLTYPSSPSKYVCVPWWTIIRKIWVNRIKVSGATESNVKLEIFKFLHVFVEFSSIFRQLLYKSNFVTEHSLMSTTFSTTWFRQGFSFFHKLNTPNGSVKSVLIFISAPEERAITGKPNHTRNSVKYDYKRKFRPVREICNFSVFL